jgi:uncharacterized protein (DUF58 family)
VLASALLLAVAAYALGIDQFLFVACLLAVLIGLCLLLVRYRAPRLSARRRFSHDVISVGSPVTVTIDLSNDTVGRSSAAVWTDRLPWEPGSTLPARLPALPSARYSSRGSTRLDYVLHPPQRGIVDIGPVAVERADPFGLSTRQTVLGDSRQLIVAPRITPLAGSGFSLAGGDGSVRASRRNTAGSNDDLMTREYRRGDALRRVHWRATARHGDLMVRQEEESSFPTARLVLDTRDDGYDTADDFEWALGMVASVGVHLVSAGFQLHLRETAHAQLVAPTEAGGGTGHDVEFLTSLASVDRVTGAGALPSVDTDQHGPVFAVVAAPSGDVLRWIVGQRAPHEHGVAIVVAAPGSATVETFARAGWHCVAVTAADDPAEVWTAALDDEGASGELYGRARFAQTGLPNG